MSNMFSIYKHSRHFIYAKMSMDKLIIKVENKFDFWVLNAFRTVYFLPNIALCLAFFGVVNNIFHGF